MLSVRCSEGICLKNRNQEAAARCPATACYVNWLRFRWANDAEPVLRQVLTVTHGVQYFVKALTKKMSAASMVSSHGQKLSLHFADRHFEWLPNSERDAPGGKAVSLPRTTTYKAPNGRDH
jgi:hypothetical protein